MRNKNLFFLLVFLFLFSVFSQELTITTYYPSPVGIYKELKSNKLGVGPNTDPATLTDGELEVEGKLTVGGNSLIDGNLSVEGNSIVKRNLIIGGKVGIGTTNPDGKLQVVGDGVVVGNPTGGNKGAGTINAEEIYVQGEEIGGFSECEIVTGRCVQSKYSGRLIQCDVSCPSDKWLISGGGGRTYCGSLASPGCGLTASYPKVAGKGGTWHVEGEGLYDSVTENYYLEVYALCCK